MQKTVLIAGGSGLIGNRLAELFREENYSVRILSRSPRGEGQFAWDPAAGRIDEGALKDVQVVVNLAGAGIADRRWTAARKRLIVDSRVQSARTLAAAIARTGYRPEVYLSASAIGYYGNSGEREMQETDRPVDESFMVDCCRQWETAADEVAALGIRTVKFRIGIVLDRHGGALAEFVRPLHFGVGAYFADGRAWYSWIHRDDVCRFFRWAAGNPQIQGVFNAVAPNPVRNKALLQEIVAVRRRPALVVPAPAFALRLALGEMAHVVLNSNLVSAQKALNAGFEFRYPGLKEALQEIF